MTWRTEYLANLINVVEGDSPIDNREFLALCEIEREIRAKIDDYIAASNRLPTDPPLHPFENQLLNERQLVDLFTLAMADRKLSELELDAIQRFAEQAKLPPHIISACREEGRKKAKEIYDGIVTQRQ